MSVPLIIIPHSVLFDIGACPHFITVPVHTSYGSPFLTYGNFFV